MALPGRWVWLALGVVLLVLLRLVGVRVGDTPAGRGEPGQDDRGIQVYYLLGEADGTGPFIPPGGWKWDLTMIRLTGDLLKRPQAGVGGIEISYQPIGKPEEGSVEIYWNLPEQIWEGRPGGELPEARRLVFKVRGRKGGEQAEFQAGGLGSDVRRTTGMITLAGRGQEYEIPLTGMELNHLRAGFCFQVTRPRHRAGSTIYLDEIRLEVARTEEQDILEDAEGDEITILSIAAPQP